MKLKVFSVVIFSSLYVSSWSQNAIEWVKNYGGDSFERAYSIQHTTDGGFIISGATDTNNNGDVTGYHGGRDVWVLKLNGSGDLEWQKAYGGSGGEPFTSTHVIQTADGGFLITGDSQSSDGDLTDNNGNFDIWVFRIDANGNIQWQNSIGGSNHELAYAILEESDGGFLLAGSTSSTDGDVIGAHGMADAWLVKLSATGTIDWQKTFGGTWTDGFTSIQHTTDGGYIATGSTLSDDGDLTGLNPDGFMGYADYWVVKLDSDAEIEWQSVIGGSGKDDAKQIVQTSDGGYIVAGESESNNGNVTENFGDRDWWVAKLSSTGSFEWGKTLGGSERDELFSAIALSDGSGVALVGFTESVDEYITNNHGEKDIWLVKLDLSGAVLWNQCFGGTTNDRAYAAIETTDNKIVIAGEGKSAVNDNPGNKGLLVFQLNPNYLDIDLKQEISISFYPNPVEDVLHFSETLKSIEITSLSGQTLMNIFNKGFVDVNALPSGTYLLKAVTVDDRSVIQKIVKR